MGRAEYVWLSCMIEHHSATPYDMSHLTHTATLALSPPSPSPIPSPASSSTLLPLHRTPKHLNPLPRNLIITLERRPRHRLAGVDVEPVRLKLRFSGPNTTVPATLVSIRAVIHNSRNESPNNPHPGLPDLPQTKHERLPSPPSSTVLATTASAASAPSPSTVCLDSRFTGSKRQENPVSSRHSLTAAWARDPPRLRRPLGRRKWDVGRWLRRQILRLELGLYLVDMDEEGTWEKRTRPALSVEWGGRVLGCWEGGCSHCKVIS